MMALISVITQEALDLHKQWLTDNSTGRRLVTALGKITIEANLRWADLSVADLGGANLRGADLGGADLRGADLDFSCWPLWCGSKGVKVDCRIAAQLAGHGAVVEVVRQDSDTDEVGALVEAWQDACRALGEHSHRAIELGLEE